MVKYQNARVLQLLAFITFACLSIALLSCAASRPAHGCGCGLEERMGRR